MFYQKGINIGHNKEVFDFLKNHYRYWTMSSWNGLESIANNVKVYNLDFKNDCYEVLSAILEDDYTVINLLIEDWEREHPGYAVGFNGRSGGYLVLYGKDTNGSILPADIFDWDSYDDFKAYARDCFGNMKYSTVILRELYKLVSDFDKLCDSLVGAADELYEAHKEFEKDLALEEAAK